MTKLGLFFDSLGAYSDKHDAVRLWHPVGLLGFFILVIPIFICCAIVGERFAEVMGTLFTFKTDSNESN